jgi:hypothetical protein
MTSIKGPGGLPPAGTDIQTNVESTRDVSTAKGVTPLPATPGPAALDLVEASQQHLTLESKTSSAPPALASEQRAALRQELLKLLPAELRPPTGVTAAAAFSHTQLATDARLISLSAVSLGELVALSRLLSRKTALAGETQHAMRMRRAWMLEVRRQRRKLVNRELEQLSDEERRAVEEGAADLSPLLQEWARRAAEEDASSYAADEQHDLALVFDEAAASPFMPTSEERRCLEDVNRRLNYSGLLATRATTAVWRASTLAFADQETTLNSFEASTHASANARHRVQQLDEVLARAEAALLDRYAARTAQAKGSAGYIDPTKVDVHQYAAAQPLRWLGLDEWRQQASQVPKLLLSGEEAVHFAATHPHALEFAEQVLAQEMASLEQHEQQLQQAAKRLHCEDRAERSLESAWDQVIGARR